MAPEVFFHPLAAEDLDRIDDYIARDSPVRAEACVARIKARCESLASFPRQGRARPDLIPGLRLLAFERRAVIAYWIEADQVTVWRIIAAGRDVDDLLGHDGDGPD